MTTSVYQYITVANLEGYTGINYETTKATYTDVFVEAQISVAERIVNAKCDTTFTAGAAPDGVIVATLILSERFMRNVMVVDGYATEMPQSIKDLLDVVIDQVLQTSKNKYDIKVITNVTDNFWNRA